MVWVNPNFKGFDESLPENERLEHREMVKLLKAKCTYARPADVLLSEYKEVKRMFPGNPAKMADYIYDKYFKKCDTLENLNNGSSTTKAIWVAQKTNTNWQKVWRMASELEQKCGSNVLDWVKYVESHRSDFEYEKKETPQPVQQTKQAQPVQTVQQVRPAPRPAFVSTGNTDLDGLLILRANMSCVMGYDKAKSMNIKKTNDEMNKIYAVNNKDYADLQARKKKVEDFKTQKRCSEIEAESWGKHASKAILLKKKKFLQRQKFAQEMVVFYDGEIEKAQRNLDAYIKSNSKKWGIANKAVADCQALMKKDFDDIQKAYRDFENQKFCIEKQDYQYLDYLIYLFNSHRATTLKEALNELDSAIRHNELMNAINNLSKQINQSLQSISTQIAQAANAINTNLGYINSNIQSLSYKMDSLENTVNDNADRIVAQQIRTQKLVEEGNRIASMNYAATKSAASNLDSIKTRMYY